MDGKQRYNRNNGNDTDNVTRTRCFERALRSCKFQQPREFGRSLMGKEAGRQHWHYAVFQKQIVFGISAGAVKG